MTMLWRSGKFILYDMVSSLCFLGLFSLTHNIALAAALGIAIGVAQIGWDLAHRRPIGALQWLSVALVMLSGIGSILMHDVRIVLMKPSVIYVVVGATMLKPGWMTRYMPPEAIRWTPDLAIRWGYVWAGLMFLSAALNLALAFGVSFAQWALYMSLWAPGSKLVLFAIQFTSMRMIGAKRARAEMMGLTASIPA